MNNFIFKLALSILVTQAGCTSKDVNEKVLTLNLSVNGHDTCIRLGDHDSLRFLREIEIVENHLSDTVLLGYALVTPNYLGKIMYLQNGVNDVLYFEPGFDVRSLPFINSVCFQPYKNKKVEGYLKIKLQNSNDK